MYKIIYVGGALADAMGNVGMIALAQAAANLSGQTVDLLTHGDTTYHGKGRWTAKPDHNRMQARTEARALHESRQKAPAGTEYLSARDLLGDTLDDLPEPFSVETPVMIVAPAAPEVASAVVNAPINSDGRSEWVWLRKMNGDLMLGCFPRGETYFMTEEDPSRP